MHLQSQKSKLVIVELMVVVAAGVFSFREKFYQVINKHP